MSKVKISNKIGTVENEYAGDGLAIEVDGVKWGPVGANKDAGKPGTDATGALLGGEQSGHLVFGDLGTTGDGLLSAVILADLVRREGVALGDLVDAAMTKLPQVLRNVAVQIFRALLENNASFYGSQMSAMRSSRNSAKVAWSICLALLPVHRVHSSECVICNVQRCCRHRAVRSEPG